ncbi:MAG: RDD family protein [Clostridiaceae bacterium]
MFNKKEKGNVSFLRVLAANIIDVFLILLISIAVLLLGDFIMMKAIGYFVADLIGMLLLMIIIVAVIYNTVLQSSKKCSTFGQRIAKIKIVNGEMKIEKR